jgi:type I restriction enzyme R subunit
MTSALKEITFESEICEHLASHGWLYSPDDTGYDRDLALFPTDVFGWLAESQPVEWAKLVRPDAGEEQQAKAKARMLKALSGRLDQPMASGGGTLNVLRKGFQEVSARFEMVQPQPTESLNPALMARYGMNRLRVMRQVHYSKHRPARSIDLVLFCNGVPVATIELKTDFTQSVTRGMVQYAHSRQPTDPGNDGREPLLTWGARAVVHFVATNTEVAMTTKLDGPNTVFLPFNKGHADGGGNPPNPDGPTAWFWQEILDRDLWLKILTKYLLVKTDESIDPTSGKLSKSVSIRFPRYHQLSAVEAIIDDAYNHGAGQRYLIEHSAGSGKTDTIVWTAHRLAALHDANNAKVFDSVIVVTDRTVLDDQMSRAMAQLDHKQSQVVSINGLTGSKSAELAEALAAKTPIIVVTLQTAPFALAYLKEQTLSVGGRFAVIADEAHSSQTGDAAAKLREVLSASEIADLDDGGEVDTEAVLAATVGARAASENISYLAFTATPKAKTMELFGRPTGDSYESFHRYSMRQAIEEGYILDVLANYTPYKVAFKVAHDGQEYDSETVDRAKAVKSVMRWVRLHPHNISQKVQIIVEHFRANIAGLLDGNAKAMVVTASRKEAIRYHRILTKYITDMGYSDLRALVAFSDRVVDEEYAPGGVTEHEMNPDIGGKKVDVAFNGPDYQVLIVANKYQVGFDQPLLCAMYVDKRLDGVMAVQTLSRLNRTWAGKDNVYVIDFVNNPDDILAAFLPYYRGAALAETTDPNLVHLIAAKLDESGIYDFSEVQAAAEEYVKGHNAKLSGVISKPATRFTLAKKAAEHAADTEELERLAQFRSDLVNYCKAYTFLSQIVDYGQPDLEKRYIFYKALAAVISLEGVDVEVNLTGISLTHHRISAGPSAKLDLETGEPTPLTPMLTVGSAELHDPNNVGWAEIIDAINTLFEGSGLSEADRIAHLDLVFRKARDVEVLVNGARHNTDADFYQDAGVLSSFVDAVLAVQDSNTEFTDTVLADANRAFLLAFLKAAKFREFLSQGAAGSSA